MMVLADGTTVGTVGGGRMEHEVAALARAVASGAPATRVRKHLVRDLAMCCGGEMELWIEPLDAGRAAVLGEAGRRRRAREPVAMRTQLAADGGKALEADDECLRTRRPRLEPAHFVEPILPAERLVIFGAGHIARATAAFAERVGFDVVVCDEDETYCSAARFPSATRHETFDVAELERAIGRLGRADHVLIATRDHAVDQSLLEHLLPRGDLATLGMVGSRGKLGRFRKRLAAKGLGDDAAWARLRSPVGLDLGAETPEEIALAVVAELVKTRAAERACASPR
jgi:xanthine dehydrogenase accessory factor